MLPFLRYGLLWALFWSLTVVSFAAWSLREHRSHLVDLARQEARDVFAKDLLAHRWSAALGDAYLPLESSRSRSAGTVPELPRTVTTESGLKLSRIIPVEVTRRLQALQQESEGVLTHLTSLAAEAGPNAPDDWEKVALRRFAQGEEEASVETRIGGAPYLRLMRPLIAEQACLPCHAANGSRAGDVLGGISVSVPMQPIFSAEKVHADQFLFWTGVLWLIGLTIIAVALVHLRRQECARAATEQALRDSEAEFRLLADHANDVIWTMDLAGRFTYVSPSVERQMGYSQEEALQLSFREMLTPASLPSVQSQIDWAVAELTDGHRLKGTQLEVEQHKKDGSRVWFEVTFTAIYGPAGGFLGFMGVSRNITARKGTEQALKVSEEKYRSIFESFQDLYYRTDQHGMVTEITPSIFTLGGYTQEEVLGKEVTSFYADAADRCEMLQLMREQGALHDYETKLKRKDGRIVDASLTARLLFDGEGRPVGVEGILRDISERKLAEARLRDLSLKDELTGLHNRRGFITLAEQQMKSVERHGQFVALIYADLDGMKWINDTLGHKEGDRALVDSAAIMKRSFRESDIVARLGGDEFVGLAVMHGRQDGDLLLARLSDSLDRHNRQGQRPYRLAISFGIALYDPQEPCELSELMERGDAVMYEQKQQRKSRRSTAAAAAPPDLQEACGEKG